MKKYIYSLFLYPTLCLAQFVDTPPPPDRWHFYNPSGSTNMRLVPAMNYVCLERQDRTKERDGAGMEYPYSAISIWVPPVNNKTEVAIYAIMHVSDVKFNDLDSANESESQNSLLSNIKFTELADESGCRCKTKSMPGCEAGTKYSNYLYVGKVSKQKLIKCWGWDVDKTADSPTGQYTGLPAAKQKSGVYVICRSSGYALKIPNSVGEPYDSYRGLISKNPASSKGVESWKNSDKTQYAFKDIIIGEATPKRSIQSVDPTTGEIRIKSDYSPDL